MNYSPTWEICWIDSLQKLIKVLPELKAEDYLSVDTETYGWKTGNEQLGLIQIGRPTTQEVFLIDPINLPGWEELLKPVLEDLTPRIIAHNAAFEERQFARHGIKMRGAVDTLRLAQKLRPDLPSKSLRSCCKFILNIELSKEEQASNWQIRPLSSEQIKYAALDVEVTFGLFLAFQEMQNKLNQGTQDSVPQLMENLYQAERDYFNLIKDFSTELELLRQRKTILKEAIRDRLKAGEPAYDGAYGKAQIKKIRKTEINPQKVRELMPLIADLAIKETIVKSQLASLMAEHGYDKKLLPEVTELIKMEDRLELHLADF